MKKTLAIALISASLWTTSLGLHAQIQSEFHIEALVANTSRSIMGIKVVNNSSGTIQNLSFNYYFTLEKADVYHIIPAEYTVEILEEGARILNPVPVSVSTLINIVEDAYYFKVTLQDGTDVGPGESGEVFFRFNDPIYSFNHYSNQGLNLSFHQTSYITLYDGDTLIWGIEPTLDDLLPTPSSIPTPAPSPYPVARGDVNASGSIDIVDALLVAQYYVGLAPASFIAANADTNCSGTVDIVDALLIAQYYVGLISQFC